MSNAAHQTMTIDQVVAAIEYLENMLPAGVSIEEPEPGYGNLVEVLVHLKQAKESLEQETDWQNRALKAEARLSLIEKALGYYLAQREDEGCVIKVEDSCYTMLLPYIMKGAAEWAASAFDRLEIERWPELHRLILAELADMARRDGLTEQFDCQVLPVMAATLVEEIQKSE